MPDGGRRTQYYWSGEDGILYHTEKNQDTVIPFFDSVEDAERFLEHQAEEYGKDRYSSMVLRKTGNQKVEEATDVLTDQSGLMDFAPDGGIPSKWPEKMEYDQVHRYIEHYMEEGLEAGHAFVSATDGVIRYDRFLYRPAFHQDSARKAHWEIYNEYLEEVDDPEENKELFVEKLVEEFDDRVEQIMEENTRIDHIPILDKKPKNDGLE